jgi:signal transduction histidine kinase
VILADSSGGVWVALGNGALLRFRDSTERPVRVLGSRQVVDLLEDSGRTVWAAAHDGLWAFDNDYLDSARLLEGTANIPLTALAEDRFGRIWMLRQDHRLAVRTADGVRVLGPETGVPEEELFALVDDRADSLWLTSRRGIYRIAIDEVDGVLAGQLPSFRAEWYGVRDGMRTIECHGVSRPAICRQEDGSIWVATVRGFVRLRPEDRPSPTPIPATIESIGTEPLNSATRVTMSPDSHDIEIRYNAIHLAAPERISFRYRMEHVDNGWVYAGQSRTARYAVLPPGQHRFFVEASPGGGAWSSAPARVTIIQQPNWYQSWSFRIALAMLGLTALFLAIRVRERIVAKRHSEVLAERSRIAHEWHDSLLSGLNAITWQLQTVAAELPPGAQRANGAISMAGRMLQHCVKEARRVIWDLHEQTAEDAPFEDALKRMTSEIAAGAQTEVRVVSEGTQPRLSIELRQNLLRIGQEAVTNAVRHGCASQVETRILYEREQVSLLVRDNGCGMEAGSVKDPSLGHFGITFMRERAERLGGFLRLDSRPGGGTLVEVKIPVGRATKS